MSAFSLEAAIRVGPMAGPWQNWKSKPMSPSAFILGLGVLILVEILVPIGLE
jgi:hypothetical protein